MNTLKKNIFLIISIFLFLCLTLPFLNILPYMDGNIDFIQTLDFYNGGISQYFLNWNTVHPPFKLFITLPLYLIFGVSAITYSIPGIVIGILGIISIYLLTKDIFGKSTANLAAMFFSIYPLFISNSVFMMRDAVLTVFILKSILFYERKKFVLYGLFSSFAILTKESALLLPLIIIFIESLFWIKKRKINLKFILNFTALIIPLTVYYLWKLILGSYGKNSWSEWIFTETGNKGAIFTILNNLFTQEFINPYAFQHWKQLIFLNFNWIYIILIILGIIFSLVQFKKINIHQNINTVKTLLVIAFFIVFYLLTVLSLQTYTIPRYALPITPFIIVGLSRTITIIKNKYIKISFSGLIIIIIFTSLFSSIDPIANRMWGETEIFKNKLYGLNNHMAGNDGITYNIQYLLIARERSNMIKNSKRNDLSSKYCRWIFPDPNNEIKMFEALNINSDFNCNQTE